MILGAASRLSVEPQLWMFMADGEIVGETAGIPVELQVGGIRRRASWLVDSKALEQYRAKAVGTRLVIQAAHDTPIALSLGQDDYMRRILMQLGWTKVTTLEHLVYPLRSAAVLRGKLGGTVAGLSGHGIDMLRRLRQGLVSPRSIPESTIVRVERFGSKHDLLWDRIAAGVRCACVRDASFLNWKYVDRPHETYAAIDVHSGDQHIATVVLGYQDADESYGYRRALLLELLLPAGDRPDIWTVLDAVTRECHANDIDAIHTQLTAGDIVSGMLAYGFLRREGRRHLLVSLGDEVDAETAAIIRDANAWWLTMSDSDMDGGVRTRPPAE
jgi:hypothetical protein